MPQSLTAVHIHLIFSTKDRRPWLDDKPLRDSLHSFLAGISKQLECYPIQIGGVQDHVHILASPARTISMAEWVKELKRVSNPWVREQRIDAFQWQAGYAAFSVSQSNLEQVKAYIAGQEEHHRMQSFQDELRTMFHKHGLEYDERFVWD